MIRLKELRRLKGVTQGEIANALNITSQVVSRYENNLREPDIQTLCALADYFCVSIDELLGHAVLIDNDRSSEEQLIVEAACLSAGSKEQLRHILFSEDEIKLIEEYNSLTKDDQLRLREIMRALRRATQEEKKLGIDAG